MSLSLVRLRETLSYDPLTGHFTRLVDCGGRGPKSRVGAIAGRQRKRDGYIEVMVDRKAYAAHRLAFFWMTGGWPIACIDHINRCTSDNRWANLRHATVAQNNANSVRKSKPKRDADLPRGVYRNGHRFQAQYGKNGYIGLFATVDEAGAAVLAAMHERGVESFRPGEVV